MKICGKPAFVATVFLMSGLWNAASAADFTACNLWYEKPDRLYSTGYQKGALLPAGTEVKDVSKSSRKLDFTDAKSGTRYSIEFIAKHNPGVTPEAWADRVLTSKSFSELTKGMTADEIKSIKVGQAKVGMSKKAVLVSLGYPPEIGTPSTDSDAWKYWRDRFRTYYVKFANGKVSSSEQ